jgi:hypothetical protein
MSRWCRGLGVGGRLVFGGSLVGAALLMAGCVPTPPVTGPDRSEVVAVPGGTCEIIWWLSPAVDDPPAEAMRIATAALDSAEVSDQDWSAWYMVLVRNSDDGGIPEIRLRGTAYLEAVREDVRVALDDAGYSDFERVIEVYSDISCTKG